MNRELVHLPHRSQAPIREGGRILGLAVSIACTLHIVGCSSDVDPAAAPDGSTPVVRADGTAPDASPPVPPDVFIPPDAPKPPVDVFVPPDAPKPPVDVFVPPDAPKPPVDVFVPPDTPKPPTDVFVPPDAPPMDGAVDATRGDAGLPGRYLMAFHSCDSKGAAACGDPKNHYTHVASSDDGVAWAPVSAVGSFQGSVPDIIRRQDTLYIYNPGRVRAFSISTGTLGASRPVTIKHADGTPEPFVDPSLYLDEATGRIVLMYLASAGVVGDPAQCQTCPMRTATEVDGSDGTEFVVDAGDRILVARGTDPDIYFDGARFIMLISQGTTVYAASATDLRGSYSLISGLNQGVLSRTGGVPAGHFHEPTAKYWTYVHTASSPSVITRATHDGFTSELNAQAFSTVISGATYPGLGANYHVQSPGFLVNE